MFGMDLLIKSKSTRMETSSWSVKTETRRLFCKRISIRLTLNICSFFQVNRSQNQVTPSIYSKSTITNILKFQLSPISHSWHMNIERFRKHFVFSTFQKDGTFLYISSGSLFSIISWQQKNFVILILKI